MICRQCGSHISIYICFEILGLRSKIYERTWDSLAHVWSEWNGEYEQADFPRLIVRFEGKRGVYVFLLVCHYLSCLFLIFSSVLLPSTKIFSSIHLLFWRRFVNASMLAGRDDTLFSLLRPLNKTNISVRHSLDCAAPKSRITLFAGRSSHNLLTLFKFSRYQAPEQYAVGDH